MDDKYSYHTSNVTFGFSSPPEEILRIDKEGFHYNGEIIKDAGKAYEAFMQTMKAINESRN